MKPVRIFSLLFSLCQLLLFLKLIELVRGQPHEQSATPHPRDVVLGASRAKQKRYRPWFTTATTEEGTAGTTLLPVYLDRSEMLAASLEENQKERRGNGTIIVRRNGTTGDEDAAAAAPTGGSSRLCPGCEGNVCGGNLTNYGFPVVPVIIAIIVGIIWFFVFLFIWYFASGGPPTGGAAATTGGYAAAAGGGYGGGGGSGWGSGGSGGINSILDLIGGNQRSFDGFNDLTTKITEALLSLSGLYGN